MVVAEAEAEGRDAERQLTDRCGRRSSMVAWVVVVKLKCEVSNHPARDAFSAALVNGLAVGRAAAHCHPCRQLPTLIPSDLLLPAIGGRCPEQGCWAELGQIAAVPRQTWSRGAEGAALI
jgi:hypothetical protein